VRKSAGCEEGGPGRGVHDRDPDAMVDPPIFARSCQCRAIVFRLGFPIPIGHENHEINEISQMQKRM